MARVDPRRIAAASAVRRGRRVLERRAAAYVRAGAVALEIVADRLHLAVRLRGAIDRDFFRRARRPIDQFSRRTPATLALDLKDLRDGARPEIERLRARLARYGDRIAVRLPEGWQRALAVDSSVFELVLGEK